MNSREPDMHAFRDSNSQIRGLDMLALRHGRYRVPGRKLQLFKRMNFLHASQRLQMDPRLSTYPGRVMARRCLRCHFRFLMAFSQCRVRRISVIPIQ